MAEIYTHSNERLLVIQFDRYSGTT